MLLGSSPLACTKCMHAHPLFTEKGGSSLVSHLITIIIIIIIAVTFVCSCCHHHCVFQAFSAIFLPFLGFFQCSYLFYFPSSNVYDFKVQSFHVFHVKFIRFGQKPPLLAEKSKCPKSLNALQKTVLGVEKV